jgi:hypothetical protein
LLLTVSLFANGVLVAATVVGSDNQPSATVPVAVRSAAQARSSHAVRSASRGRLSRPGVTTGAEVAREVRSREQVDVERKVAIERKILALVLRSPNDKLPRRLIDPVTGLAKSNLQAICRREKAHGGFLCIVRPLGHAPKEGLYVRYGPGPNGRSVFTWYRYRRG